MPRAHPNRQHHLLLHGYRHYYQRGWYAERLQWQYPAPWGGGSKRHFTWLHDEKMREAQDDGTKIVKMVCIRRVLNNCLFVAAEIFIERKITANHKDQLFIKPLHIWMQYYPWKILHLIRSFDSFIWSQVIDVLLFVTSWTDKNNLMLHIVKNFWPIWVLSHHLFEIVIRKYLVNTLTIE